MYKSLFCLPNNGISGGNKIFLGFAELLVRNGQSASAVILDSDHYEAGNLAPSVEVIPSESLPEALRSGFDFVFFSNLSLVPLCLPLMTSGVPTLVCQSYESFCYGRTMEDAGREIDVFVDTIRLPIELISTSRSVQNTLEMRTKRQSYFVPLPFDQEFFSTGQNAVRKSRDRPPTRVLMVGDYMMPVKGMADGFRALELLDKDLPIQLVLLTQQRFSRSQLPRLSYDNEVHCRPDSDSIPSIYASCHAYLCSSWYEGFGLPCLEAFSSSLPVVCTDNGGVHDFGQHAENLLVAKPADAQDMAAKLKMLLTDNGLTKKLVANALATPKKYTQQNSLKALLHFQSQSMGTYEFTPVTASAAHSLLERMIVSGVYTPSDIQRNWKSLSQELDLLLESLAAGREPCETDLETLERLKSEFAKHLDNDRTEYFNLFRSCYDVSRMITASLTDPRLPQIAAALRFKYD